MGWLLLTRLDDIATVRDRELARERMRKRRRGSSTMEDTAYHWALQALRDVHREEFERIRCALLRELKDQS